jgi:TRAP-type transport system periplasmic protein
MRDKKIFMFILLVTVFILAFVIIGCEEEPVIEQPEESDEQIDEVTEWLFFSAYGPEDGAICEIWPQLFEEVKEATGGRLVIETYWYGQHPYEGEDMLQILKEGNAQLTSFYGGYISASEPVLGMVDLPLLLPIDPMESWEVVSHLWGNFEQDRSGVLEDVLQSKWNASMVHSMPASPQRFFTVGYAVEDIESFNGRKVRVYSPELAKLVEIMGGTPVSVSFSEVYTSLSTNLIDGLVTSTAFGYSGGFFDFCDHINMWEIASGSDGLMVNLDALNSLPPDVKDEFLRVMRESAQKPEMLELNQNDEIVNMLVESNDVKVVYPTEENRNEVIEIVKNEIWEPFIDMVGDDAQRVLEQIEEMQK